MKKVTIKAPDPKTDVEKAKRVYRLAVEIIRRHDEIIKQKRAYRDVFLPEAILLRDRLQEYCEKIMFYCPANYGRKAEEILWRKAFYEIIQLMKCNKKHVMPNTLLANAYRTHLTSATGYYHHLLCRLQSEVDLNLEGIIDFYYLPDSKTHRKSHSSKVGHSPEVQQWALQACHRCLIYLGDLARYQLDFDGMSSKILAQRYYYQALTLCPEDGMPNNQLGTLAGSSYYGLDAAYYYIRCLVCPMPFEGAHSNLVTLFERNRKRFNELNQSEVPVEGLSPEQQQSKDIKRFISRFLQLLDIFYTKSQSLDAKGIQDVCQSALHDFNLCMFSQSCYDVSDGQHPCDDKPCHLSDEIVFKIFVICLAIIHIMQKEGNKQVAAAIAFSLALFSHTLNHAMMRLQTALYEVENPPRKFTNLTPEEVSSCTDADETHENSSNNFSKWKNSTKNKRLSIGKHHTTKLNGKDEEEEKSDKKKVKKSSKLRRMRRRKGSESSSESDGNTAASKNSSDHSEESESEVESSFNVMSCALSSSDSEDNLMVSQELRPGFSSANAEENCDEPTDSERHLDMAMDVLGGTITDFANKNESQPSSVPSATAEATAPQKQSIADMTEYLKDISLDWLSDAANLLHQTLQFTYRASESNGYDSIDNKDISAVVQGTKQVRVPPGFEASNELRYVMEISEKLANFEIETDTDISLCVTDAENSTVTDSEMETETETDKDCCIDRSDFNEKRVERLIEVVMNKGLLSSIKVYCDWLRVNPHIIATCAKISSSIWYRLSLLLNFLPSEMDLNKTELCDSDAVLKCIQSAQNNWEWLPTQPLTEDLHLCKFSSLEMAHRDLVFDMRLRQELSARQEAILRICYLRRFGYFIARLKSVRFTFSKDSGMFYGPQQMPSLDIVSDKKAEQDLVNGEARRNQLMRDMAQLRLKAEVSELEGSLKLTDAQSKLPPYLVPDALSLSEHLNLMKQLAACSKFIIIIPVTVVDHLDFLKKDMIGAREAIRWLEAEFHKGSRFVRAQKAYENNLSGQQKVVKKDKDMWRTIQIVDCCKYLSKQNPNCDLHSMVTLLTKMRISTSNISIKAKEVIAKAMDEGLNIQTVPEFFGKWKETSRTDKG